MKFIIIFTIFALGFKTGTAQSVYFSYNGKTNLSEYIGTHVRPIPVLIEHCMMPFTYIKFKITKDNTVDSLNVTNNSIDDLKKEITKVMSMTNGHWNIDQTKDKWLVIPLLFYTDYGSNIKGKGCDFKKILELQSKEIGFVNNEPDAIYFPIVKITSGFLN